MSFILKDIILYDKEKKGSEKISSIDLISGKGIPSDKHFDKDSNQISVLFVETSDMTSVPDEVIKAIKSKENFEKGLCHKRYKANLYIMCDQHPDLAIGREITIGNVVLSISKTKPCFDECELHQNNEYCFLKKNACFVEVKTGGIINVEDSVNY